MHSEKNIFWQNKVCDEPFGNNTEMNALTLKRTWSVEKGLKLSFCENYTNTIEGGIGGVNYHLFLSNVLLIY